MNLLNIFNEIENADPEIYDRLDQRRKLIKNFVRFNSKLAIASVPIALGGLLNKAYGKVPDKIIQVLQFALGLEHLEKKFYQTAMDKQCLIPSKDKINKILEHEIEHVKFLQEVIKNTGNTPVTETNYDFTAKGLFPSVFSDYKQFLMVAQAFEDTGVGAYKGQASELKENDEILTSALRIHSMEARHSAHIRYIRMINGFANVKPWIVGDDNSKGTPFERIYKREKEHRQVMININNISHYKTGNAGTSAFDEPLHKNEVMEIISPFMV